MKSFTTWSSLLSILITVILFGFLSNAVAFHLPFDRAAGIISLVILATVAVWAALRLMWLRR